MLYIVASFYAKRHTTQWVATYKTESDADAPLVTCAFVLKTRPLLAIGLAVRAFE